MNGRGRSRWKRFRRSNADQGGGWNDLEITATGMRIRSVLNGVTVVDSPWIGVNYDCGNTYLSGEDPYAMLEAVIRRSGLVGWSQTSRTWPPNLGGRC